MARKRSRKESESEVSEPSPIVLRIPGQTPDTLLNVLGRDYHVHSIILKLHSNFFRRFLDSPDKSGERASHDFRYHYVTVIDDDKSGWSLQSIEKATPSTPAEISSFELRDLESMAFGQMICAMYNRNYIVKNSEELSRLINMADFFCALPVISATIVGALLASPMLKLGPDPSAAEISPFAGDPFAIAEMAVKIRNPVVFREAIVHAVALWDTFRAVVFKTGGVLSSSHLGLSPSIFQLIEREYARICALSGRCSHQILCLTLSGRFEPERGNRPLDWRPFFAAAPFYRTVKTQITDGLNVERPSLSAEARTKYEELKKDLDELLQNKLVLDQSHCAPGEEGCYLRMFLSAHIMDEDLPWDSSEIDW